MTEQEAINEVKLYAQTDAFPSLTNDQVTDLVRQNMRAVPWETNKAYSVGQKVQPSTPNGHFYICVQPGVSGETEPDWTKRVRSQVSDAAFLIWQQWDFDPDGNLYNTRDAIHAAWLLKASMAANQFDTKIDDTTLNRSQIYENCMKMARSFSPVEF